MTVNNLYSSETFLSGGSHSCKHTKISVDQCCTIYVLEIKKYFLKGVFISIEVHIFYKNIKTRRRLRMFLVFSV